MYIIYIHIYIDPSKRISQPQPPIFQRAMLHGFKQVHLCFQLLKAMPAPAGFISAYGFENGNPRRLTHAFNYKGAPLAGLERKLQLDHYVRN